MKASRKLNFDNTDIGFYENEDDPFDDNEENVPVPKPPRRSVTLNDFLAPGLLSTTSDVEEEEFNEEELYDENYEEEEFDDAQDIQNVFKELDKKWDYSECDKDQMIDAMRNLNYNVEELVEIAIEGSFGKFTQKRRQRKKAGNTNLPPQKGPTMNPSEIPRSTTPTRSQSQMLPVMKPSQHQDCKRTRENVLAAIANHKKHLNLVIVGHVDAGKSTLIGHLLVLHGDVSRSELSKIDRLSEQMGKAEDKFAWVMAEDQTERERGVTIDVSMTQFETEDRSITVLDAPGHRDFVPNMIAGASQADAALLVVDVGNPLIDRGQAKEHILLCRALGVSSLIVAINKMDSVNYDESAYNDIKNRLILFLKTLGWTAIHFVPTAASIGDNLLTRSNNTPWYKGPVVIEAINQLAPAPCDIGAPLLMCVSESVDTGSREVTVVGRLEGGYVCSNDNIRIFPYDKYVKVTKVAIDGKPVPFAISGTIAEISFTTTLTSEIAPIGSAILSPEKTIPVATQFVAKIVTFNMKVPLLKGAALVFHRHAVDIPLRIVKMRAILNRKTQQVSKKNPEYIPSNAVAEVVFRVNTPVCIELHSISKSFGRFIIRASGETLGFGSVLEIIPNIEQNKK